MFCYIKRDLSTYLQLSLCLSALLNWGQYFSSPSVSLTLTVPDIQEIQTGAAVFTYRHFFSLQTVAASILQHGRSALGGRVRAPHAPSCPHPSPSLGSPMPQRPGETLRTGHTRKSLGRPHLEVFCAFICIGFKIKVFVHNIMCVHKRCLLSLCLFAGGWLF